MAFLIILSRWVHVISACVAIGGIFFAWLILPAGLGELEPELRQSVFLKIRRRFKMVVHSAILLLLISGVCNSLAAFPQYNLDLAKLHMLWGIHILLGLIAFLIALYVLMGKTPPAGHWRWMAINLAVLAMVVAAASTLKSVREKIALQHAAQIAPHP